MTVSLIAAVAANRVIGSRGRIPWRIPDDMARFRRLTMGHPVIMGRSTFESLAKPLAGRINIVLTKDRARTFSGCVVVHSLEEALHAAEEALRAGAPGDPAEVFVIGGALVYGLFLPAAQRMYITWVDADVPGDSRFPDVAWDGWRAVRESVAAPVAAVLPHRFIDYVRRSP